MDFIMKDRCSRIKKGLINICPDGDTGWRSIFFVPEKEGTPQWGIGVNLRS